MKTFWINNVYWEDLHYMSDVTVLLSLCDIVNKFDKYSYCMHIVVLI